MGSRIGRAFEFALLVIGGINLSGYVGEQHRNGFARAGADIEGADRRELEQDGAWLVHASFFAPPSLSTPHNMVARP